MVVVAVKRMLKRSDLLVNVVSSARGLVRTNLEIVEYLAAFLPNSDGSLRARRALALQGAQQIFPLLSSLISATATPPTCPVPIADIFPDAPQIARRQN